MDFAHNPAKVKAALATAKGIPQGQKRRVLAVFILTGFAPMKLTGKDIMDAMAEVLDAEDRVSYPKSITRAEPRTRQFPPGI